MIGAKHNWVLQKDEDAGYSLWKCSDCGIDDDDPLSQQKCLRFNMLACLLGKMSQLKKSAFRKAGLFLLMFSR